MQPDAFTHLPELRHCVLPAARSTLRITPEVLAQWDERARGLGRGADWRLPDADIEASRQVALKSLDANRDLWIFGYGSLMWDPGFHFEEVRRADLPCHQRRFTFRTTVGRGSPERPGLMLSLEAGGSHCCGLAFRVKAALVADETQILWRREMIRGSYTPRLLPLTTPQGEIEALVFAANASHPDHVGVLPLTDTAAHIATASGVLGPNAEYVELLVAQLSTLEICDDYIVDLLRQIRRIAVAA